MNELAAELLEIARSVRVEDAKIVRLSRHPAVVGLYQGKALKFAFAGTASDCRSHKNAVAAFYRKLGVRKPRVERAQNTKPHGAPQARGHDNRRPHSLSFDRKPTRLDRNPFEILLEVRDRIANVYSTVADGGDD